MATDYLQKCCDLHTELTEIRFSRRQDLGDIERAVAHVRSSRQLTYDDIEKIRDSRVGMPICSATGQAVRKSSRFSIPRNGTSGTSRSVRTRRLRPSSMSFGRSNLARWSFGSSCPTTTRGNHVEHR